MGLQHYVASCRLLRKSAQQLRTEGFMYMMTTLTWVFNIGATGLNDATQRTKFSYYIRL